MSTVLSALKSALAIDFGIQGAGFLLSALFKTERHYDLFGSCAHLLVLYNSIKSARGAATQRQWIQTGCAALWAARLGFFLFTRVLKDGHDRRFNKLRDDPKMMLIAWTMQGVWVFCNILPTLIQNAKRDVPEEGPVECSGWVLWAAAFLTQVIADHQKTAFRADPANEGKFISTGLWSLSRHPNYFGEILMWAGLYIASFRALKGWEHVGVISPIMSALLLTQVSGIPMLERAGLKRWGSDPLYQKYLKETPSLIPNLLKLFSKK